jgi:DNA-binding MarR family transcriptional regulator
VDRLVKQGLVSRSENPDDRRVMLLHATPRGEELVAGLRERKRGFILDALGRLTEEELAALAVGLEALARAAGERDAEATGGSPPARA